MTNRLRWKFTTILWDFRISWRPLGLPFFLIRLDWYPEQQHKSTLNAVGMEIKLSNIFRSLVQIINSRRVRQNERENYLRNFSAVVEEDIWNDGSMQLVAALEVNDGRIFNICGFCSIFHVSTWKNIHLCLRLECSVETFLFKYFKSKCSNQLNAISFSIHNRTCKFQLKWNLMSKVQIHRQWHRLPPIRLW